MERDKRAKKRVILKIGTSTLTKGTAYISRGKIEDIARQIKALESEYEFILVCSGAIAVAKQFVQLEGQGRALYVKQALAAIGQPHLMRIIQDTFRELDLLTAQCLLSYMDFERRETKENIINTIDVLVENNYIPVINENDTVSTDEIQFGDNDKLAALSARLLHADLLIIATNTYGMYNDKNETIPIINDLADVESYISEQKSSQGTGGMQSKLLAARIAQDTGIETWLVNGKDDQFLIHALKAQLPFTKITAN